MEAQNWILWMVPIGAILAALISARASSVSAKSARLANITAVKVMKANERIAENDSRILLMEERLKVWRAFNELMLAYRDGYCTNKITDMTERCFESSLFIFDEEMYDYLGLIISKVRLAINNSNFIEIPNHLKKNEEFSEQTNNLKLEENMKLDLWIFNQQDAAKAYFIKHMRLID